MTGSRPDWHEYFLEIANAISRRADCRRRQHGAVIVSPDHRVVSTGYNGAPSGKPGCLGGACPRGLLSYEELASLTSYDDGPGRCISVHAEANAIIYAGRERTLGATIYITGKPCPGCRKLIAAAGIAKAVYPSSAGSGIHVVSV